MAATAGKFNGTHVKLFIGTVLVGHIREFSLDESANMIDTSTKDSGKHSEFLPGRITSTISASGVFAFDATEGYAELWASLQAGTKEDFILSNENVGDYEWGGFGFVSGLPVTFPDDDVVTFDLELQVTGAVTYTEIV